jgi:hypothetical protein
MACCFPTKEREELAASDEVPEMGLYDIRTVGARCRSLETMLLRCRLLHAVAALRTNFADRPKRARPRAAAAKRARMRRECAALQRMNARAIRPGTPPPPA